MAAAAAAAAASAVAIPNVTVSPSSTLTRSALLSKTWQLREAALLHLCRALQRGTIPHDAGTESARELVRCAGPTLQRLLRDKVGGVLLAAQQVCACPLVVQRSQYSVCTDIQPPDENPRVPCCLIVTSLHRAGLAAYNLTITEIIRFLRQPQSS